MSIRPRVDRPARFQEFMMSFDQAALDRLLDLGGPPLVLKMIDAYLGSSPQRVEMAQESMASGDLKGVEQAAHSLKSSSANFGATSFVELVAEVERLAADEQRGPRLDALVAEMPGAFSSVCRHLESLRGDLA